MSADAERRSRLLALKLRALIRDHLGLDNDPIGESHVFGLGAAFVSDDATWVLIDGDASRAFGPSMAWAVRHGRPVRLLVENSSGVLARRASLFSFASSHPGISSVDVWHVNDRQLLPAIAEDHLARRAPKSDHLAFVEMIGTTGADVVIEHGVVAGEVRGLEMCRVVDDEVTGSPRLEVGMGVHDREAFAMVHGHLPTQDALRQVIDAVIPHRIEGAAPHPLNQFGAERLLRWQAMQQPEMCGFESLGAIEPPVIRSNLKDAVPCAARGRLPDGTDAVAVFVHGVDLDVASFAADVIDREGLDRGIIVLREKDVVPSLRMLASSAISALDVVTL